MQLAHVYASASCRNSSSVVFALFPLLYIAHVQNLSHVLHVLQVSMENALDLQITTPSNAKAKIFRFLSVLVYQGL